MITHIVFLKSHEENQEIKSKIINDLSSKLRLLPKYIEELKSLEVGINISDRDSAYDLSLHTTFENNDDLNTYRFHKEHIKVIQFIKANNLESAVVDYIK